MSNSLDAIDLDNISAEELESRLAETQQKWKNEPTVGTPDFISIGPLCPAEIPATNWLIPNFLLRGTVTLAGGMGGVGKSLFAWNLGATVAIGSRFAWFEAPGAAEPVIVLSGEDDTSEIRRRLAAACGALNIQQRDLADNFLAYPSLAIGLAINENGKVKHTPLWKSVRGLLAEKKAGLLIIDPLIKAGAGFDENSNADMEALFMSIQSLVDGTDCAALVLDHFAKSGEGSSQNAIRGASAKVNASRATITLSQMSETDFKSMKLSGQRERYILFQTPKLNYGKRTGKHWFELTDFPVGNGEMRPAYVEYDPKCLIDPRTWEHRDAFLTLVKNGRDDKGGKTPWRATTKGPREARLDTAVEKLADVSPMMAQRWVEAFEWAGLIRRVEIRKDGKPKSIWELNPDYVDDENTEVL